MTEDIERTREIVGRHVPEGLVATAESFFLAEGERGVYRRQAAIAYPMFTPVLFRNPLIKIAIDRGQPLKDVVQRACGADADGRPVVSKAVLQHLLHVDWRLPEGADIESIAAVLSALPPNWLPNTAESFEDFCAVAVPLVRHVAPHLHVNVAALLQASAGDWAAFRSRVAKSLQDRRPPEGSTQEQAKAWLANIPQPDESAAVIENGIIDFVRMVETVADTLVIPVSAHLSEVDVPHVTAEHFHRAREAAFELLFGGQSLPKILEVTRHFSTQAERILEAISTDEMTQAKTFEAPAADGWPSLFNTVTAPNGVIIKALTSPNELKWEGGGYGSSPRIDPNGMAGLNHCVGGYASRAKTGEISIISFRVNDPVGRMHRLSTMEISRIDPGTLSFTTLQHRGEENAKAPEPALEAEKWFRKSVESGDIPINFKGVMDYQSYRRTLLDDISFYCMYDWRKDDECAAATNAFEPWMPKRLRGLAVDGWADEPAIASMRDLWSIDRRPQRAAGL